ncbi:hypothetical protein [Amycolatopsis sp. MEPSY49]|uniref:hypothetical protein n=1 Tax=Amycolatopsis sp. MEPSY49 TaxID=3151600 RepID=UPI003EF366FC
MPIWRSCSLRGSTAERFGSLPPTMNHPDDRFLATLRSAYHRLLESGVVSLTVDGSGEQTVAKLEPVTSRGPRVELRSTGTVAELFLDDLDPFEVDAASANDLAEFESFARALADGNAELVFARTLLGRRPAAVGWPGGRWSLPANPGVVALFSRPRREKIRGYDR